MLGFPKTGNRSSIVRSDYDQALEKCRLIAIYTDVKLSGINMGIDCIQWQPSFMKYPLLIRT